MLVLMESGLERDDIIGFEPASGHGMGIHAAREETHAVNGILVEHVSNAAVDGIAENDPGIAQRDFIQGRDIHPIGRVVQPSRSNILMEQHHLNNGVGGIGPHWGPTGPILDIRSGAGIEEDANGLGKFVPHGDMERGFAFDIFGVNPSTVLDQVLGNVGASIHDSSMERRLVEKVAQIDVIVSPFDEETYHVEVRSARDEMEHPGLDGRALLQEHSNGRGLARNGGDGDGRFARPAHTVHAGPGLDQRACGIGISLSHGIHQSSDVAVIEIEGRRRHAVMWRDFILLAMSDHDGV